MESTASSAAIDAMPIQLWIAYPDDLLDEASANACAALLSDEERMRWQRYRFARSRREYLATHALARTALAGAYPIAPADWSFTTNEYGKPAIIPDCGLRFNLSNSPGMVVCLIAHGADVGVDIEPTARAEKILALQTEVFSAKEREQLAALSAPEQLDRAVALWTLKESYIKARGMGLRLPLRKISFLFDATEGIRLELESELQDTPDCWRFCLIDHAGHHIASMVQSRKSTELQMWQAHPILSRPKLMQLGTTRWHPYHQAP